MKKLIIASIASTILLSSSAFASFSEPVNDSDTWCAKNAKFAYNIMGLRQDGISSQDLLSGPFEFAVNKHIVLMSLSEKIAFTPWGKKSQKNDFANKVFIACETDN